MIDDDHEPEEGEITNTDDEIIMNETTADFEYEAISSEEEFSLRQKIEALEARNLELEKIASISCECFVHYIFSIEFDIDFLTKKCSIHKTKRLNSMGQCVHINTASIIMNTNPFFFLNLILESNDRL